MPTEIATNHLYLRPEVLAGLRPLTGAHLGGIITIAGPAATSRGGAC